MSLPPESNQFRKESALLVEARMNRQGLRRYHSVGNPVNERKLLIIIDIIGSSEANCNESYIISLLDTTTLFAILALDREEC